MDNFWSHRRVLVTGGSGFLGCWLVKLLTQRGASVITLTRDKHPAIEAGSDVLRKQFAIVYGEVENYPLMCRIVSEYEIQTVFHLAAQTLVGVANETPLSTFETNIKGTWNILEACRHCSCVRQIVVASSDKAYGNKQTLPYREEDRLEGCYPYDVSKTCADLICRTYFTTYRLPVCITRCANLYGGGDLNFSRIVPGTIRSVYHGTPPIIRSDGTYTREYFYVEDAALAYVLLAEQMDQKPIAGQAYNFSSREKVSALELAQRILTIMQSDLKPEVRNLVTNEIREQSLSVEKAATHLNWHPSYSLDEGLRRTVLWYQEYFSRAMTTSKPFP